MADPFRLDNQTALVTGIGGGIGRALLDAFTAAGARVIGADRDKDLLADLPLAGQILFDQADMAATRRAITDHLDRDGIPDIVVANAGWTRAETFDSVDDAVWANEIATNLNGAFAVVDPVVARMRQRGRGAVVLIASVNALGHYGNPAYSAAKAGLLAYAKALAVEHGRDGIRANAVCPGSVRTPAWDHRLAADPTLLDDVLPHYPLGRMVSPQEVAQATVFLASPAASGITGVALPVDAGLTAGNLRFVDDVLRANQS